jgi:hypothetical protein
MAAPYVTGAMILAHVRKSSPAADDTAWAVACADAIESLIAYRMAGVTITAAMEDELIRAALQDGAAAYMDREAPHGVQSFGPDGESVRLGRDLSRALYPVFIRYAGPGIG